MKMKGKREKVECKPTKGHGKCDNDVKVDLKESGH